MYTADFFFISRLFLIDRLHYSNYPFSCLKVKLTECFRRKPPPSITAEWPEPICSPTSKYGRKTFGKSIIIITKHKTTRHPNAKPASNRLGEKIPSLIKGSCILYINVASAILSHSPQSSRLSFNLKVALSFLKTVLFFSMSITRPKGERLPKKIKYMDAMHTATLHAAYRSRSINYEIEITCCVCKHFIFCIYHLNSSWTEWVVGPLLFRSVSCLRESNRYVLLYRQKVLSSRVKLVPTIVQ